MTGQTHLCNLTQSEKRRLSSVLVQVAFAVGVEFSPASVGLGAITGEVNGDHTGSATTSEESGTFATKLEIWGFSIWTILTKWFNLEATFQTNPISSLHYYHTY